MKQFIKDMAENALKIIAQTKIKKGSNFIASEKYNFNPASVNVSMLMSGQSNSEA